MSEEKKKCLECNKEIKWSKKSNAFECEAYPGAHRLPEKTYYHPGGQDVDNLKERRMFGPHMILRPGMEKMSEDNELIRIAPIEVFFVSGKYTTDNAEEQYYLDEKYAKGQLCDENRWNEIYLTPQQQVDLKKAQLADLDKRIRERNSLLEMAQKGK